MFNFKRYITSICLSHMIVNHTGQTCLELGTLLFDIAQVQKIIQEPIFNLYGIHGNIMRSLITNPSLLYYNFHQNTFSNFTVSPFAFFSTHGVYFNPINTVAGFVKLINTAKKIMQHGNVIQNTQYELLNFPFLAEAMHSIKIQNKTLGFSLEGTYQYDDSLFLYCQIPFSYTVLHPSLPSEVQGKFSNAIEYASKPNFNTLPSIPEINQQSSRNVIIDYSVVDSFGIANSVIGIGKKICDEKIILEGRVFLPGTSLKNGIMGGKFTNGFNPLPNIPTKKIIDSIIEQKELPYSMIVDIEDALKYISNRVVLGSYYYNQSDDLCRMSPSLILKLPLGYSFYADFYTTYIYSFSKSQLGIGMGKNDLIMSNKIRNITSVSEYQENQICNLIEDAFSVWSNYLVPKICPGTCIPGGQFQGNFAIRSSTPDIILALGIDAWHQNESYFIPVTAHQDWLINPIESATQCNLFLNFEYYRQSECLPLTIQLILQATIFNRNIQEEFGGKLSISMQY